MADKFTIGFGDVAGKKVDGEFAFLKTGSAKPEQEPEVVAHVPKFGEAVCTQVANSNLESCVTAFRRFSASAGAFTDEIYFSVSLKAK